MTPYVSRKRFWTAGVLFMVLLVVLFAALRIQEMWETIYYVAIGMAGFMGMNTVLLQLTYIEKREMIEEFHEGIENNLRTIDNARFPE